MINRIVKITKKYQGIDFVLNAYTDEAKEFFLIRDRLDLRRRKSVEFYSITVYKDFTDNGKSFRGSSTVRLHPTLSDDEISSMIERTAFAAGFVRNEPYPLPPLQQHVTSPRSFPDTGAILSELSAAVSGPD
ncbi:MAG: modulator protein, partial [Candidatus Wallbacteria bacterium]|nr:modulator protein [Candidatus Wallbacteria bacterium]